VGGIFTISVGSGQFQAEVAVKKILAGAVGGAAVFAAILGAGPANAVDEYKGLTYEKALEYMGGQTPIIASRVGSYLPTEQCIVSGSRSGGFLDSSGNSRGGILLDLNCNDTKTAGHPGYSVMTPQGKEAQQLRKTAISVNEDFAAAAEQGRESWCQQNADRCVQVCERSGECSAEVSEFLGL
jgi:hypothetical protein